MFHHEDRNWNFLWKSKLTRNEFGTGFRIVAFGHCWGCLKKSWKKEGINWFSVDCVVANENNLERKFSKEIFYKQNNNWSLGINKRNGMWGGATLFLVTIIQHSKRWWMAECYRSKLTGFGGPKTTTAITTASTLNATSWTQQRLPVYNEKVKSPSTTTSTADEWLQSSRQKNGLGNSSCCNNSYSITTKNNYRFMIRRKKMNPDDRVWKMSCCQDGSNYKLIIGYFNAHQLLTTNTVKNVKFPEPCRLFIWGRSTWYLV